MGKIVEYLIIFGLLITPILNIGEIVANYNLTFTQQSIETPIYIKLLKDFLFISLIIISFFNIFVKNKIRYNSKILILIFLTIISSLVSLLHQNVGTIISGFRWAFVFFLTLSFLNLDLKKIDNLQEKISKLLIILIYINLLLQFFQLLYFPVIHGKNFLGLNLRNTGFFSIPQTAAFFTMIVMWYIYVYYNNSFHKIVLLYFLSPISILLTASGTGLVALFVFYLYLVYKKVRQKKITLLFSLFFIFFFFFSLDRLTGREDIFDSIVIRIGILKEYIFEKQNNIFLSTNFGRGTNTSVLFGNLANYDNLGIIADSLINSMIINLGILGVLIFIILILSVFIKCRTSRVLIIIYSIFSITNIFFESYPMNLIFALNIAYFCKEKLDTVNY
ncbi:hypothetical protein [Thermodesulfovibrio sp.]|uniref:hypothetical protein n=1 Tax=Thermodesulfovibrio sp. TaxID=2067987 RepID=UPI00309CE860